MRTKLVSTLLTSVALLAACGTSGKAEGDKNAARAETANAAAEAKAKPAGTEAAPSNGINSAYTDLRLGNCQQTSQVEEGASASWSCPGYQNVPLFVATGDDRISIGAGVDSGNFETLPPFSSEPDRIEWRLRNGAPFAIIYRLRLATNEGSEWSASALGVSSVGAQGRPGCVVAWVDGNVPNANDVARRVADERASSFRCGSAEAEMIHAANAR